MLASEVTARMLAQYESGDLIIMCSWCKRIEIDGGWDLAPRAAVTAIQASYTFSHSICPDCTVAVDKRPRAV
jgi:hypothetical protein